jgi:hypothetical protein
MRAAVAADTGAVTVSVEECTHLGWAMVAWERMASRATTTAAGLLEASVVMAACTDTLATLATVIPTTTRITAINRR